MVEHEPRAVPELEENAYGPEDVRRVAALDCTEATAPDCLERQHKSGGERVDVFDEEFSGTAPWGIWPVLVDLDSLDDLVGRISRTLGADHRYLIAGPGQGTALQPDSAVERHRKILDNYQDAIGTVPLRLCSQRPAPWCIYKRRLDRPETDRQWFLIHHAAPT